MNNNYDNNQNMNNNYGNPMNNNGNQFVPNGMPQSNMPQQNNNQGGFTGITPNMVNNQAPVSNGPASNQTTFVNNEVSRSEMNEIIEKNLPKLMNSNSAKNKAMRFLIAGGVLLLLGIILFFTMDEGMNVFFLVMGIIFGAIFIPIGLFKLNKAGKYPVVDFNIVRQELYAPDCLLFKEIDTFFTKNFMVKYGGNKFVFPYRQIAMAYTQQHQQSQTTVNTGGLAGVLISGAIAGAQAATQLAVGTQDIVLKTKSGVTEIFLARKREDEILTLLQDRNPDILIGNTKENREAYKAMKNSSQPVQQPVAPQMNQQPMNNPNMGQPPMGNQPMQGMPNNQGFGPQPMPNQNPGMNQQPGMPQGPMNNPAPNNGMYQRPAGGQPRSFSSNINDQQTFNRF